MPSTMSVHEGSPASWPYIFPELDADWQVYSDSAWARIESYIAFRWPVRSCVFIVEGPGKWIAPLQPFRATITEVWLDQDWVPMTLAPNALGGFVLDGVGPYRIIGELGSGVEPPPIIRKAVLRLAEYFKAVGEMGVEDRAANAVTMSVGALGIERQRSTTWVAKALQQSGAADLLRPFRRATYMPRVIQPPALIETTNAGDSVT